MSEIKQPQIIMDTTISSPAKVVQDNTWITLKVARSLTNRGKTTIRNWIEAGRLPTREGDEVCMVLKDALLALHKNTPTLLKKSADSNINAKEESNTHCTMPTSGLRAHPLSAEIYGNHHDLRLLESVKESGILSPLLMTADGLVISGGERLWAAKESGMAEVPVCIVPTTDESELKLQVLEANIARDKTNEQRIREYKAYKEIEAAKAQTRRGTRNDLVQNSTPSEVGKARDIAAAKVGWSGSTAEKGAQVLGAIESRSATESKETAEDVRRALNETSIDAAYKQVIALGWLANDSSIPNRNNETGKSETVIVKKTYQRAKTAASKLSKIVAAEEIALFTLEQIKELRDVLQPLLKWIDGLESKVQ